MEQFRKFLRDKAFALVLTACLLAAAAAGVWAVRTVRNELKKDLDAVRSPSSTAPGILLQQPGWMPHFHHLSKPI